MTRKYIFLFIACFSIFGLISALFQGNPGATKIFLITAVIFSALSWSFAIELITGKPPKKLNESTEKYQQRLEQREKANAEKQKQREIELDEQHKWETVVPDIFKINREDKIAQFYESKYEFNKIIGCDLVNDSSAEVITETTGDNRKKVSFSKALIGGALFGPIGAIIGGGAGKTKINQKSVTTNMSICSKLQILVTVADPKSPIVYLNFIENDTYKNSYDYEEAFKLASKTLSILRGVIHENTHV